jgi:hypothetical protein
VLGLSGGGGGDSILRTVPDKTAYSVSSHLRNPTIHY